jgi:membrane fusion protein (multidrug efflux system)
MSSVPAKAEIPSVKNLELLLPAQFVRVRLVGTEHRHAIGIPPSALISTPTGSVMSIVDENSIVEARPVNAESIEDKIIVYSGVKESEIIISERIIKARPARPVNAVMRSGDQNRITKGIKKVLSFVYKQSFLLQQL